MAKKALKKQKKQEKAKKKLQKLAKALAGNLDYEDHAKAQRKFQKLLEKVRVRQDTPGEGQTALGALRRFQQARGAAVAAPLLPSPWCLLAGSSSAKGACWPRCEVILTIKRVLGTCTSTLTAGTAKTMLHQRPCDQPP